MYFKYIYTSHDTHSSYEVDGRQTGIFKSGLYPNDT